jgi:hypothetical protein
VTEAIPFRSFEAAAKAFRPGMVEIIVESESSDVPTLPNEQLETKAREHVAEVLDQRDREIAECPAVPVAPTNPTTGTVDPLAVKQRRLTIWLRDLAVAGWKITTEVIHIAERLAKLTKDLNN